MAYPVYPNAIAKENLVIVSIQKTLDNKQYLELIIYVPNRLDE